MNHDDAWDGAERRSTGRIPTVIPAGADGEIWRYIISQLESTSAKLDAIHLDMIGHKADIQHIHNDVEALKRAFPRTDDGERDYDGHRYHHDKLIADSRRRADIGHDVLKKVFGGLAWVTLAFVAVSLWNEFKRRVGMD